MAAKDIDNNILTVVQDKNHLLLFQSEIYIDSMNWINRAAQDNEYLGCRIRHRQTMQNCQVRFVSNEAHLSIHFEQPQRAVAAGQSTILYRGNECIGGGLIRSAKA